MQTSEQIELQTARRLLNQWRLCARHTPLSREQQEKIEALLVVEVEKRAALAEPGEAPVIERDEYWRAGGGLMK